MADNILLITTDQQRFDTIQALGNRSIFTPHLNYIASQGMAFTRCYADCPICVPSRTTIMTGQRGFESGVISNATHAQAMSAATKERRTLPAILTDAGYQTCAMGKMHFDPPRAHYGFEEMRLPLDYMRQYDKCADKARPKIHGVGECLFEPVISTVEVKDSITAWITDGAVDFLETRDPTRPFFLWTSYTKPHPPFDPCRDFWEIYDGIPMPEPVYGDWSQNLEEAPQGFLAGTYENSNVYYYSKEQIAASRRAYYAMITQVDYSLGRLFGCLRENHLLENTWVIFTADHGEMLGDHYMAQKNMFFEGCAHVPLLIMPPQGRNLPRNIRVDTLAEIADVFPTILAMAGVDAPKEAKGKNLLELSEEREFYGAPAAAIPCSLTWKRTLWNSTTCPRTRPMPPRGKSCLKNYWPTRHSTGRRHWKTGSLRRRLRPGSRGTSRAAGTGSITTIIPWTPSINGKALQFPSNFCK